MQEIDFKQTRIEFNQLMTEFMDNSIKAGIEPYPVLIRIAKLGILNELGVTLMIGFGIDEFSKGNGGDLLRGIINGVLK